jgi:hypothetical protein
MKTVEKTSFGRRGFLGALGAGAVAVVAPPLMQATADSDTNDEKRKGRYTANSAGVQTYYRVNRYPI